MQSESAAEGVPEVGAITRNCGVRGIYERDELIADESKEFASTAPVLAIRFDSRHISDRRASRQAWHFRKPLRRHIPTPQYATGKRIVSWISNAHQYEAANLPRTL